MRFIVTMALKYYVTMAKLDYKSILKDILYVLKSLSYIHIERCKVAQNSFQYLDFDL